MAFIAFVLESGRSTLKPVCGMGSNQARQVSFCTLTFSRKAILYFHINHTLNVMWKSRMFKTTHHTCLIPRFRAWIVMSHIGDTVSFALPWQFTISPSQLYSNDLSFLFISIQCLYIDAQYQIFLLLAFTWALLVGCLIQILVLCY